MYYTDENKFTEDEREAMDGLARVVAFVCDISYEAIRSNCRKRPVVDAKKIACKYAYDNIPNSKLICEKNLALCSWYFKQDHGTIHYTIAKAQELYETEPNFAKLYDAVVNIVDNPTYEPDFTYSDLYKGQTNWDGVRMNINERHSVRYRHMPQYVKDDIIMLFGKGYGELTIAKKVETTLDFINYFIKREGLKRDKMAKIRKALSSQSVKFGYSKSIAY